MQKITKSSILLVSILGLAGCVGQQPTITPQKAKSIKNYIAQSKKHLIIAQNSYKTLYLVTPYAFDIVNQSAILPQVKILENYCKSHNGNITYGKQIHYIFPKKYPNFSEKIDGLLKCSTPTETFEIYEKGVYDPVYRRLLGASSWILATYDRLFLIKYQSIQPKINDSLYETDIPNKFETYEFPNRDKAFLSFYGTCIVNNGKPLLKINNKVYNANTYLLHKFEEDYKDSPYADSQFLHLIPQNSVFYCQLPNKTFKVTWQTIPFHNGKVKTYFYPNATINNTQNNTQQYPTKQNNSNTLQQINTQLSNISIQKGIGYKVLATKRPFLLNTGMVTYLGYYIGNYQGCDRSAVIVKAPKEKTIYNYAKCGNEYKDLGVTPPVAFDKMDLHNIKALLPTLKTNCKMNGSFEMRYRNNDYICKYKDETYQVFIMQNGYLAGVEEER